MTEATVPEGPAAGPPAAIEERGSVYSKDYWDLVFEQLARRKLFKLGLVVLALMYASAIYAPFIANDRPFVLESIDLGGYRSASGSLSAVATGIGRRIRESDEEYRAQLESMGTLGKAGVPQTRAAAIEQEHRAAKARLDVMRAHLPDDLEAPLDEFDELLAAGLETFAAGEASLAEEQVDEAKRLARTFRRELAAWDPTQPDREGIRLVAAKSHPLWESIAPPEVFFMVLWLCIAGWPLWNPLVNRMALRGDRERIRRWRRRKLVGVVGLCLASALAWRVTPFGADGEEIDVAPKGDIHEGRILLVKAGMRAGDPDSASQPIWPPVVFGFVEQHGDAESQFRPPTWTAHAAIDEEGRYVSGPRAAAEEDEDASGHRVPAIPVEVRAGELPRNHPLRRLAGTDVVGRDFFTRMLWGGRVSLTVGILSAALLTLIGVAIGSVAGYFGGWVDIVVMRLIEVIQSIPAFFLILATMAFLPPDMVHPIFAIVVVIAIIRWTGVARLVRAEFLRLREQEFVIAARALGFSNRRTIFRHVLPNAMSPVLVSAAFAVAAGILTESAISFLGFGTRPPDASWGSLVNESKNPTFWWIQVFPGVLIFLTVTCYNLVGDAIRDALDPKMKH